MIPNKLKKQNWEFLHKHKTDGFHVSFGNNKRILARIFIA